MTTDQWLRILSMVVPLLSLLVTAAVLIRRGGSESGALRARVKAVCEKFKSLKAELLARVQRVESNCNRVEEHQRQDTQRIFTKLEDLDERNQARHVRLRSSITTQGKQITALLMVNPEINQEMIDRLTAGGDPT